MYVSSTKADSHRRICLTSSAAFNLLIYLVIISGFIVFENGMCSAVWNILLEKIWKHIARMMARAEKQLEVHRSLYESNKSKELLFPLTSLLLFLLSCCHACSWQVAWQARCLLNLIHSPMRREDRVEGMYLMISYPQTLLTSAKVPHCGCNSAKYQALFVKTSDVCGLS